MTDTQIWGFCVPKIEESACGAVFGVDIYRGFPGKPGTYHCMWQQDEFKKIAIKKLLNLT